MSNPTNNDIMQTLLDINNQMGGMRSTLISVEEQTKKTNGRVTKIEEWKNAIQAVETYKKENAPATAITAKKVYVNKWLTSDKLIAGVVAVLMAAALAIQTWAGAPK